MRQSVRTLEFVESVELLKPKPGDILVVHVRPGTTLEQLESMSNLDDLGIRIVFAITDAAARVR